MSLSLYILRKTLTFYFLLRWSTWLGSGCNFQISLSGGVWMSVRSKPLQGYLDLSPGYTVQWSVWDLWVGLVCNSVLKELGRPLRVRSTHAQLPVEPRSSYILCDHSSQLPPLSHLLMLPSSLGPPFMVPLLGAGALASWPSSYFQQLCLSWVPSGRKVERGKKQWELTTCPQDYSCSHQRGGLPYLHSFRWLPGTSCHVSVGLTAGWTKEETLPLNIGVCFPAPQARKQGLWSWRSLVHINVLYWALG